MTIAPIATDSFIAKTLLKKYPLVSSLPFTKCEAPLPAIIERDYRSFFFHVDYFCLLLLHVVLSFILHTGIFFCFVRISPFLARFTFSEG